MFFLDSVHFLMLDSCSFILISFSFIIHLVLFAKKETHHILICISGNSFLHKRLILYRQILLILDHNKKEENNPSSFTIVSVFVVV
jgi:hypothetical protein